MKRIYSIKTMQKTARRLKASEKKIGFVPTMGYLHDGHLGLVRYSLQHCSVTVVSIFVNPAQFAPNEDLKNYPRDMKRDLKLLRELGVDYVFTPEPDSMYTKSFKTYVSVEKITGSAEGKSRPTHFRGVTTIVAKLLNIVQPDVIFLGQKDIQQAIILRKMTDELNFPVKVSIRPTAREKDGLAMSSRNVYLNKGERETALSLYSALTTAKIEIKSGLKDVSKIKNRMKKSFEKFPGAELEYIYFADSSDFSPVKRVIPDMVIALAAKVGRTRLIDNIIISPRSK